MKQYDVIIVGAGPAGLKCAEILAKGGKSVLLLEKNREIGPKVCTGILTRRAVDDFSIPETILDRGFKKFKIHTPHFNDTIASKRPLIYTILREKLGQWQLRKLNKTSAEVKTGCEVTDIGKSSVTVNNNDEYGFTNLIGADGSSSIVRRHLGLQSSGLGMGFQYRLPLKDYKDAEIFFDSSLFHSWYSWIIPKKRHALIGTGANPKYVPISDLRSNFHRWCEQEAIDLSDGSFEAHPMNFDYQGYHFNNTYLIGDAAGLIYPTTGGGIHQALVSGQEVAENILGRVDESDRMKEILHVKRVSDIVISVLERSGIFRKAEYELLALMLKSRIVDKELMKYV